MHAFICSQVYDSAAAHAFLSGAVFRERCVSCFDTLTKKIIELEKEVKAVHEDFSKALLEVKEGKKEVQLLRDELTVKDAQISEIDKLKLELESEKSRVRELESNTQREVQMRRDTLLSFPRLFKLALEHKDVMGIIDSFNRAAYNLGRHSAAVELSEVHPTILPSSLPFYDVSAVQKAEEVDVIFKQKDFPILDTIVRDPDACLEDILALVSPPDSVQT